MELTHEELQEFRTIWKKVFKEEITISDARQCALQLIELYAQLAKPLPSERKSAAPPDQCATSFIAASPPKPKTGRFYPSSPSEKK